ncbi:MAG: hypothetical protein AB7I36_11985 [Rhodospirillaceae bacterium]
MLVLFDTRTQETIAKFAKEEIARAAGRFLSKETGLSLTLALTEAAKLPVSRYFAGEEVEHTPTIYVAQSI